MMKPVAHPLGCSHLPLSGHTNRIKALPPSSTKIFLPPSRHMEPITITLKSMKLSGRMDRIKALPSSSMKKFLRPSRHMERITRRSKKTLVAVENNNRVSPPTTAGHDELLPLGSYKEYREYMEKQAKLPPMSLSEVLNSPSPKREDRTYFFHLYDIEKIRRNGRKLGVEMFRSQYTYGSVEEGCNNSKEQKTCIWPGGTLSWQDESSGIIWVGVYGRDSICVVTRNEDPDESRLRGLLKQFPKDVVLFRLMESSIVEIEDLAGHSVCDRFHTRIKKPFGVGGELSGISPNLEYIRSFL